MRKKILFVRPTLGFGGADRVTLNLLRGFDRSRFECDLALMKAEGDFLVDTPKDVNIFNCKSKSLWVFWIPLIKIIKKGNYDVVYSTSSGSSISLMLAVIFVRFKGISIVSERTSLNSDTQKRRLILFFKKRLYKKVTWVTAVSKGVGMQCQNLFNLPKSKIKVVYNPIINNEMLALKEEKVSHPFFYDKIPVIVVVGRFVSQKDYPTLIRAFHFLQKKMKTRLFILGEGPLKEDIEDMIIEYNLTDSVHLAGFDKNPFKYMSKADVFVLSSKQEGLPGVLIQAMACGIACVATNCLTGPNEIIKDNENGFLVPVGEYELLSKRILELISNEKLKKLFKTNAPKAIENFKETNGINSYFNFF